MSLLTTVKSRISTLSLWDNATRVAVRNAARWSYHEARDMLVSLEHAEADALAESYSISYQGSKKAKARHKRVEMVHVTVNDGDPEGWSAGVRERLAPPQAKRNQPRHKRVCVDFDTFEVHQSCCKPKALNSTWMSKV